MTDLAAQHCRPLEGGAPLSAAEVQSLLAQLTGWSSDGHAIEKSFGFTDFHRTMAFVNAVAWIAHVEDHHPDMAVSWGRCTLRWNTHSVGGISVNDFICAAKVDALLAHGL